MQIKDTSELLLISRAFESEFFESGFNDIFAVTKKAKDVTIKVVWSYCIEGNHTQSCHHFFTNVFIDGLSLHFMELDLCVHLEDVRL